MKANIANPNQLSVNLPAGCRELQLSPTFGKNLGLMPLMQVEIPIINRKERDRLPRFNPAPWKDVALSEREKKQIE